MFLSDDGGQLLTSSQWTPTCYMCGMFNNVVRPLSSNFVDVDESCEVSVSDDASTDELKVGSLRPTLNTILNVRL